MNSGEKNLWIVIGGSVLFLAYLAGWFQKVKGMISREENENDLGVMVDRTSDRLGIDRGILRAIVAQESSWNPDANNRLTGDYGLLQLNIGVARKLAPELSDQMPDILFSPSVNLEIGAKLMDEILRAGIRDPIGIFHSWNVGWPSYKQGKRSPYIDRYVARYSEYKTTATG